MANELIAAVKDLNVRKAAFIAPLIAAYQDKTKPLEERWALFEECSAAGLLGKATYGDGFIDTLNRNGTLYDDFYIERYQTVDYTDMYKRILEDEDEEDEYPQEAIDAWREAVLASGKGSFTYDW